MATNVAAEWAIRARNRQPHEPQWLTTLVAAGQPQEATLREDAENEIERAINTLEARQREILKLFFSDGLPQAQIAAQIGETPRSVRRQIAKSYEKLRHELDPELLEAMSYGRD